MTFEGLNLDVRFVEKAMRRATATLILSSALIIGCAPAPDLSGPPTDFHPPQPPVFTAGTYDLTAEITSFDPAWGDLTGYRYTAVITSHGDGTATFQNFRLLDAAGNQDAWIGSGYVDTYIGFAGRIVSDLVASNFHFSLIAPIQDPLDSRRVTGTWGCCGHIAGTFTAKRRQ